MSLFLRLWLLVSLAVIMLAAAVVVRATRAHAETGVISWYPRQGVACRGMHYGPMTAAHRTLPCGSRVRVATGGYAVEVTVTDRGPFVRGRILDVSADAASVLGLLTAGVLRGEVSR